MLAVSLALAAWTPAAPVPPALRAPTPAVGPVRMMIARNLATADAATREREYVESAMHVCAKDNHETPFIQAVQEVAESLAPVFDANPKYFRLFKSMLEPERMIQFRVPWVDDAGRSPARDA